MGAKNAKISEAHNIQELVLTEKPNKTVCISVLHEKELIDNTKVFFKTEHHVKCNIDRGHRRVLAKFRSCNLPLVIETGRYNRPKTPVFERLCNYYHIDSLEDETHFLFDYEVYSDLRFNQF